MNSFFFSFSKIYFMYLMAPTDFTNDQNTIHKVIWGYIYTFKINVYTKDKTWNSIFFAKIQKTFTKLGGGRGFHLLGKECIIW